MLIVQKYGGSSLARIDQIKDIARRVADLHQRGHQLILVVSAMGKTTDELVDLAYQMSERPHRRELDMLLTTGERVSMSLMSMALHDLGCEAISFTGSQAGIMTNSNHSQARIMDLKPIRLDECLEDNKIIVLAGFQGVDPHSKEITTLGRGGTDTTAVAMAAHFKADHCQIMKDVPGVHSADPRVCPLATTLPQVNYQCMAEMCYWGAKVLHFRSVALAKRLNIELSVGLATDPTQRTEIKSEVTMYEQEQVLSINSHKEVHHLKVHCDSTSEGMNRLEEILDKYQLPWPQILASAFQDQELRMMVTGPVEHMKALFVAAKETEGLEDMNKVLSSVTATCHGTPHSSLPQKITQCLKEALIPIEKILLTPMSVSVFVPQTQQNAAIEVMHNQLIKNNAES